MSETNGKAADATISQDEDFIVIVLDGQQVTVDVVAAHEELGKIDIAHRDDPWFCFRCKSQVAGPADGVELDAMACPGCGAPVPAYHKDQRYMDDVAKWFSGLSGGMCGRKAAAAIYETIVDRINGVKKNTMPTPGLPSGTESTPAVGAVPKNEHT